MPRSEPEYPRTHTGLRELASAENAAALEALAKAAASGDQFLRRTAIEVIGSHPQGQTLHTVVLEGLGDSSDYVVRTALDVTEKWKLTQAHDQVRGLLFCSSASTRQRALSALNQIWMDADFTLVFRIYSKDHDMDVRREAARVLRQHADSKNWREIFDAFSVDEPARHRSWACEVAQLFSGSELQILLSRFASDPDGHVRKSAARAISAISQN